MRKCQTGRLLFRKAQLWRLAHPPTLVSMKQTILLMVKLISLERSISEEPEAFLFVGEKELELTDNQHQRESLHDGTMEARHLKFTIKSGYDHICAVYKIEIKNDENTVYSAASVTEYDAPSRDERSFSVPSKILEDQSASLTRADVAPPLQGHTPFMRSNVGKVVSKLSPPQEELQLQSNMKSQSGKFMDLKEITSSDEEF
ncbi:uncharacterized protein [Anabrus simplex]|uniref:uncharacterized protein isoform X2 n=1 Tax=Anabrus simplex TaxID=316456 RepID=UPI0034DCFE93